MLLCEVVIKMISKVCVLVDGVLFLLESVDVHGLLFLQEVLNVSLLRAF